MRVLVCGGRDFEGDVSGLQFLPISILIHGGAKGADMTADRWAKSRGVHTARVDALWDLFGKPAGFKRNSAMLFLLPEICIAFPGGVGTEMMINLCEKRGIPVVRVPC